MCVLYLEICILVIMNIINIQSSPNLEEDEESPESEEKADPAEELDESVGIVCCGMMILHAAGNHHLNHGDKYILLVLSTNFLPAGWTTLGFECGSSGQKET